MKRAGAFTLLELMIAMVLASFVILGMMQLYQGVVRYLDYARTVLALNRQACLVFSQMDRDFSTAYIPVLAKVVQEKQEKREEKAGDSAPPPQEKTLTPEQKEKEEKEEREQQRKFFVATINDRADPAKIDGKRKEIVKMISFMCTNPLQVYGDKRPRLVRIIYELAVDKQQSTRDVTSYQLLRKETNDLLNVEGKVDEFAPHRGPRVQQYVVAKDIKSLVVEYVTRSKPKKGEDERKEKPREITSLRWGHDNEDMCGVVPEKIDVWIEFWDAKKVKAVRFRSRFPVLSYPTPDRAKKDKKSPEAEQSATVGSPQEAQANNSGNKPLNVVVAPQGLQG